MPDLTGIGKLLLVAGTLLILVGGVLAFFGKVFPLGRLPGDIFVQKENFSFYFPIVTCIVVSIILSIILNIFRR